MISDFEQMFKNAGVALNTVILTEGVAELKRQYPLISDNDYNQLIAFDPTYKGGNELGKYGRWILDLYNQFVKDRNNEERYEKAKAYVAEHPEAKMPPAPVLKSLDRVEDFQKLPDLLKDLEAHLNDIKTPIQNFKSVADLASAVRGASEKDITVDKKAQANYKIFRKAMADGLKIIYQDNDWIIGVPETYESSAHFKHPVTNWCTAYPEKYEEYMADYGGAYYIHLSKHTGELYQLHIESDQFMDVNDNEVDPTKFIKQYPSLKEFYSGLEEDIMYHPEFWVLSDYQPSDESEEIEILNISPSYISYIKNPSEEAQNYAVYLDGDTIQYIDNPTEEMIKTAVKDDGSNIKYIDNPTEEMKRFIVQNDGYNIKYIDNPSEELQLIAIKKSPYYFQFIDNPTEKVKQLQKELLSGK